MHPSNLSLKVVVMVVLFFLSAQPSSVHGQQAENETESGSKDQCYNLEGVAMGSKGDQDIQPESSFVGTVFQRKNGDNCPCSFAQTLCELDDPIYGNGTCSSLVIDGKAAAIQGYPDIQVKYSYKLCNYNNNSTIQLVQSHSINKSAKVEQYLVDTSVNGVSLRPGECTGETTTLKVSSSSATRYMKTFLEGKQNTLDGDAIVDGFCYAYSFSTIIFKYDYGFGECNVNTKTSCFLSDMSGVSCKEHIESLLTCIPFEATFVAEACNDNYRDIYIQQRASNYKINNYEIKDDGSGSLKRQRKELPRRLMARECLVFQTTKLVDPCKPNFWQVNIQGKLFINHEPNGWFFKDRDCRSFSFAELPKMRKNTYSNIPTPSPVASLSKPSDHHTKVFVRSTDVDVTISIAPTSKPYASASAKPSWKPSVSAKPSAAPSISTAPSDQPSVNVNPSGSLFIRAGPSQKPSFSAKPSMNPTVSVNPSAAPTISAGPSQKPSFSAKPSVNPTVSVNPSAAPTISAGPSQKPSFSAKPSVNPTVSVNPSATPSASAGPSQKPSFSAKPSVNPTVSVKPSATPSASAGPSQKPSFSTKPSVNPTVSVNPSAAPSRTTSAPSTIPSRQGKGGKVKEQRNRIRGRPARKIMTKKNE